MEEIELYKHGGGANLIVKTAGNACNLDCKYCFEKGKSVPHNLMPLSVLERAIQVVPVPCSLVMHGGEPLIVGYERFQEYLDLISVYYPEKINAVRLQTNGTLLDDEWVELLFKRNSHLGIEIAISLDGTEQMNALRTDRHGNNSFDRALSAFRILERYGIRAGMLSVVSRQMIQSDAAREYVELLKSISNLAFVKINALFNMEDNDLTPDSVTPSEYGTFIIEVAECYVKAHLYDRFPLEPVLSILQRLRGRSSRYCNYSTRKCFHYLSLYPDGAVGPCDCLPIADFPIGCAGCGEFENAVMRASGTGNSLKLWELIRQCQSCDIYDFCLGGCLSHRYYFTGNPTLSCDFCESKHKLYRAFRKFSGSAYATVEYENGGEHDTAAFVR